MSCLIFIPTACSSRAARQISVSCHRRQFSCSSSRKEQKEAQPQTPATPNITLGAPLVYISKSFNPWFNLSYEDWLLRNTPADRPLIFFYRNWASVVIGRNQNPWKETTPRELAKNNISLIRRRSGGGTVYHDMGNTNFSIMLPRLLFTRSHGAELVAKAVRSRLGIGQCTVNDRNDVVLQNEKGQFKVSGSAYKIIQHRAYHHGTMLISSSVDKLGEALKSQSSYLVSKGVESYRSPVTNLNLNRSSKKEKIKHEDFVNAVTAEFRQVYATNDKPLEVLEIDEQDVNEKKVLDGMAELKSWDWTYGQTPEFTNIINGVGSLRNLLYNVSSKNGFITESKFEQISPPKPRRQPSPYMMQEYLDYLAPLFVGKKYESLEGLEVQETVPEQLKGMEEEEYQKMTGLILSWLRRHM